MEIHAGPNEWATNDSENLVKFLETETGKRFIPSLAQSVPVLLAKGTVEEILIRSGEVRGCNTILDALITLAHPPAPVQAEAASTEYPPLENDSAWQDGNKLTP